MYPTSVYPDIGYIKPQGLGFRFSRDLRKEPFGTEINYPSYSGPTGPFPRDWATLFLESPYNQDCCVNCCPYLGPRLHINCYAVAVCCPYDLCHPSEFPTTYNDKYPLSETFGSQSISCSQNGHYGKQSRRVQGPKKWGFRAKYYTINGIWALKPYHLGPWTLRACLPDLSLRTFRIPVLFPQRSSVFVGG